MGRGHDCSVGAGPGPAERSALVEAQLYLSESLQTSVSPSVTCQP